MPRWRNSARRACLSLNCHYAPKDLPGTPIAQFISIISFSMLSVEQIQSAQTEHMPPLDEASRLADLIEKGNGLHNKAKEVARESKNAASMPCILTQLFGTTRLHQIEALCRVWPMR